MKFTRRFLLTLGAFFLYGIWQKKYPKPVLSQNEPNKNDSINQQQVSGRAIAYVHCPVTTMRY